MGGRRLQWSRCAETDRYRGEGEERATQTFSLWRCWHLAGFAYFPQVFLRPQKHQSWNAGVSTAQCTAVSTQDCKFQNRRALREQNWAPVSPSFVLGTKLGLKTWTDEDPINLKEKEIVMACKLCWRKRLVGELNINHLAKFITSVFPFFSTNLLSLYFVCNSSVVSPFVCIFVVFSHVAKGGFFFSVAVICSFATVLVKLPTCLQKIQKKVAAASWFSSTVRADYLSHALLSGGGCEYSG